MRRDDLAALVWSYRRRSRGPAQWAMVGIGIGGFTLSVVLITLADQYQWPNWLQPVFFGTGWVTLLSAWVIALRRERRFRAQYQLRCPACAAPLLTGSDAGRGVTQADLAIATGDCPRCGSHILAP